MSDLQIVTLPENVFVEEKKRLKGESYPPSTRQLVHISDHDLFPQLRLATLSSRLGTASER